MTGPLRWIATGAGLLAVVACGGNGSEVARAPGEPLPGLTEEQNARFLEGRALLAKQWTPEEGLGPLFMQPGCSSCHDLPTLGGAGVEPLREATRWDPETGCDLLAHEGGPLVQNYATPLLQAFGVTGEAVPPSATGYLVMDAPALYGLGLLEAIPDETILALEDPEDANGDGISGRASRLPDGRLGRMGNKAYRATVFDLAEGAFRRSLGLTTPSYPDEETAGGIPIPPEADPVPDPELTDETVQLVTDYIRWLAPPLPREPQTPAEADSIRLGEEVFRSIGCPSCHVPAMRTGPNEVEALDRKVVHLYSDLLLHDLDPARPTICGPTATPAEVRTARLMGVRFRTSYMHDSRAPTLNRAILLHGGEAAGVRARYEALSPAQQRTLLMFVGSL
jgi:CxxC motif-containing protein (DUF1111 family)